MDKVDNYISASASIGEGTNVWRWAQIDDNAVIGENCVVGPVAFIGEGVTIGDGTRVMNGATIFAGTSIGKNVFMGPYCVVTDNPMPRVGFPNPDKHQLKQIIKDGASLGANAVIVAGNSVGECAFVGANAVVTRDVEDNSLVAGNPAKHISWICRCGARYKELGDLCHKNSE